MTAPQKERTQPGGAGSLDALTEPAGETKDNAIAFSRGDGRYDNTPEQRMVAGADQLIAMLMADRGKAKGEQWIAGPFCQRCSKALVAGKPHRCSSCVLDTAFLGLDVDGGLNRESAAMLMLIAHEYCGAVYATASHTQDSPRYRLLLLLDQPLARQARIDVSVKVRDEIDQKMIAAGYEPPKWDASCDRPEQPLYLPLEGAPLYPLAGELIRTKLYINAPLRLGDQLTLMNVGVGSTLGGFSPTATFGMFPDTGKVVEECRHDDVLKLAARFARDVFFDGTSREAGLAAIKVERDRGRWTRVVPDSEIESALDGAIDKLRTGEWSTAAANDPVQSAKTARRSLNFRLASDLIANPKPLAWLIRGLLEQNSLGLIFGDPGTGKSFLALDWAACIASERMWRDCKVVGGPVFYIAGEGGNGLGRRLSAWQIHNGTSLEGRPLFVSTIAAALTDEEGVAAAIADVRRMVQEHGVPVMIVLDTVARNFGPGDENKTHDMTLFVDACDRLREETGACVLLVHHSGHGDKSRARGSIALKGALDWEYGIAAMSGAVHLTCSKAKDAEPPKPMAFRLTTVDLGTVDEDGEPVTSAVLTPALYMAPAKQGRRGKNQTIAMRVLKEGIKQCEDHFERTGQNPDTAWMSVTAWRDRCATDGLDPKRFAEVKNNLIKQGSVRVDDDRVTLQDREFAVI